jgi:sigma-B regulation protein RsbU (phosphoserine phosphatase)
MNNAEKSADKIKVKKSIFKRLFFRILVLFILAVIVSGTLNCIENIQRKAVYTTADRKCVKGCNGNF